LKVGAIDRERYLKVRVKLGWWWTGALAPRPRTRPTCKMGHFGAKLHFVLIPNKMQFWPEPLVTNGSL